MTNEEKALEMFPDTPTLECVCRGVRIKLVEMAEWKDQQFKEYLEKKKNEFLKCTREDFLGRHFDVCGTLINEIINELFGGE